MTQEQAIAILKTGANVFLTGEPGSGKTHVVNSYVSWLEAAGINVAVTATTGIAATHIGGMTIHAWSGLGIRDSLSQFDLDKIASTEKVSKRVRQAKVLVIDEISMLDGQVLDMVDKVTRIIRQSADSFGGLQLILVGDFYQLPPITKQGQVLRYAFESYAWQQARPLICYLTEQYRQEDEMLLSLLKSIRANEIEEDHYTLLSEQQEIEYEDIEPTRLYTHNADVDAVNATKLKQLSGAVHKFSMTSQGAKPLVEGLVRNCLSPAELELKEDAMVMCTKNNFEVGYVNGTLGRVVRFDEKEGWPVIKTPAGRELTIKPVSWELAEDGKVRASIEQIPLRLAWAITVHKSQGMSLDAAEIDLTKAFVYGQGYVALSRVRTLAGLKLLGMHPNALRVDPKVISSDQRFRHESGLAESTFQNMADDEIENMQKQFVSASGGTFPTGKIEEGSREMRLKKESTFIETKRLLEEGYSVGQIAKERKLAESTVWGHMEKLAEDGEIGIPHLDKLVSRIKNWESIYDELSEKMATVGTEKLKPIFEAAGERYSYDLIRIARIMYLLSSGGSK